MTKFVKLVTGLDIEVVPVHDTKSVIEHNIFIGHPDVRRVRNEPNEYVPSQYIHKNQPIIKLNNKKSPSSDVEEVYVCWSPEVEELIGVPLEHIEQLHSKVNLLCAERDQHLETIGKLKDEIKIRDDRLNEYYDRIATPWWKLILMRIKGEI